MSCFSSVQTPSPGVKNVTRAACPPLRTAPRNHSTIRLTVISQRTFNAPLAPAVRGQRPVAPKAAAQDPMAPQQKDERGFVLKEVNILYPHQWCCGATVAQSANHMAPCAAWQRQRPPATSTLLPPPSPPRLPTLQDGTYDLSAPPPFTLQDLRAAIPAHCWQKVRGRMRSGCVQPPPGLAGALAGAHVGACVRRCICAFSHLTIHPSSSPRQSTLRSLAHVAMDLIIVAALAWAAHNYATRCAAAALCYACRERSSTCTTAVLNKTTIPCI